jgi:hypothetical protein
VQRERYSNEMARLDQTIRHQQALESFAAQRLGLSANEMGMTHDALGNPIRYRKHAGVLPGALAASGATAAPDGVTPNPGSRASAGSSGPKLIAGLTQEAIDRAAQELHTTGRLPRQAGRAGSAAIRNREAEMFPRSDLGFGGTLATYSAGTHSLEKLQTQADAVNAFERTAIANLDQFLASAKGVIDTGSPLFNAPGRKFAERVAGDPNLTRFSVARQVAVQEVGKVLSGAMGNAAISDSARHEVEQLLSPDASIAQIDAAANILKQDMLNRKRALAAELDSVRRRTAGLPAADEHGATEGGGAQRRRKWNRATGALE